MKWDHGVRNSYRMGAEGKYDLKLVNCDSLPLLEGGSCSSTNANTLTASAKKFEKSNVLANRKSSSTPSLPEATEGNLNTNSVASTDQAASADNLTWKQAVETIAENVLTSAKSDIVGGSDDKPSNQSDVAVVVHALRELENHQDLSLINHTQTSMQTTSDLATITENYTLTNESVKTNAPSSSTLNRLPSFLEDKMTNIEANNKMNSNNAANVISKSFLGSIRGCTGARVSQISSEALDVIDKMREGVDMIRNNTNNIISSDILQMPPTANLVSAVPVKLSVQKGQNSSSVQSDSEKYRSRKPIHGLKQSKRQVLSVEESCSYPLLQSSQSSSASVNHPTIKKEPESSSTAMKTTTSITPVVIESVTPPTSLVPIVVSSAMQAATTTTVSNLSTAPQAELNPNTFETVSSSCENVAVPNPMSISVPNLTTSSNNEAVNQIVPVSPPGLLETFAALARRRTTQGNNFQTNNQVINNASNINSNQQTSNFFPRGQNSVSSLVKLALSSNFHSGLLSTAQSYPSLTSSATNTSNNILNSCTGIASTVSGTVNNPTLTMSLTSTSSDSEQVSFEDFLDSCRAPTLLGELEDEEEMDDDNDDEENEDEYEEVGVSILSYSTSERQTITIHNHTYYFHL